MLQQKKKSTSQKQTVHNVSAVKQLKVKRNHSRKHPAPKLLMEIFDLINEVPDDLPWFDDLHHDWEYEDDFSPRKPESEFVEVFLKHIEQLPTPLREYIGTDFDQGWVGNPSNSLRHLSPGYLSAVERYKFLKDWRVLLTELTKREYNVGPFHMPIYIGPNQSGLLDVGIGYLEAIRGVEAFRIRQCPVCNKFYWAERDDQPACSKQHNKVRHAWISRGKYTETRPYCLKEKKPTKKGK